jgi:hypothetical protein
MVLIVVASFIGEGHQMTQRKTRCSTEWPIKLVLWYPPPIKLVLWCPPPIKLALVSSTNKTGTLVSSTNKTGTLVSSTNKTGTLVSSWWPVLLVDTRASFIGGGHQSTSFIGGGHQRLALVSNNKTGHHNQHHNPNHSVQHLVFLWCPPPIKLAITINTITLTIQLSILFSSVSSGVYQFYWWRTPEPVLLVEDTRVPVLLVEDTRVPILLVEDTRVPVLLVEDTRAATTINTITLTIQFSILFSSGVLHQ